jgi:hypothetical protein
MVADHDVSARLLTQFDPERLERDLDRVSQLTRLQQPGSYHDGDWVGLSLRSAGGRNSARPSMPGLFPYRETPVVRCTPYFREVLESLSFPKLTVRLLYLPPGAVVREHVDDMFGFWHGILRLHIPIRTHADVDFRIGGVRESWRAGELWYGNFTLPHSIVNRSPITRVHMVLDTMIDDSLLNLFPLPVRKQVSREAVTLYRELLAVDENRLRKLQCHLAVPSKLLVRLWPQLAKRLGATLSGDLRGMLRVWRKRLTLFLLKRPVVALAPVAADACTLVGWGPGVWLTFERFGDEVSEVTLRLRVSSGQEQRGREIAVRLPVLPRSE